MDDLSKACVLHEDLYKKLVIAVYQLCEWGVPVNGALEVGRAIIDNYWRKKNFEPEAVQDQKARERAAREAGKNADKSGG